MNKVLFGKKKKEEMIVPSAELHTFFILILFYCTYFIICYLMHFIV